MNADRHSLRAAFCAVFGVSLAWGLPARAAEFTWDTPAGCPDRDAIRWRVEDSLGTTLDKAAALIFAAKVEQHGAARWTVILDVAPISSPSDVQRRTLEATSCDELAQATAVAIALALGAESAHADTGAQAKASEATPVPPAPTQSKSSEQRQQRAVPKESTPQQVSSGHPLWYGGELGPLLDHGSLPAWALGVEGSLVLGERALSGRLGALALPSKQSGSGSEIGGKFSLYAAILSFCGNSLRAPLGLAACIGSELGRLSGEGINVVQARVRTAVWVAPRLDLELTMPLAGESVRLFARGTLARPLIRKQFQVTEVGLVFQPDVVLGRLGVGLELLWP